MDAGKLQNQSPTHQEKRNQSGNTRSRRVETSSNSAAPPYWLKEISLKFLQSKESEKSDILEKLTGTGIYSEIGAGIYAITKEKRVDYENQNRKLEGIHVLTEEEMTGINETMAALSSEINGNTGQKNIAALKRDWLKRNTELTLTQESRRICGSDSSGLSIALVG